MLLVTKIFTFETAHAIYGYEGACGYIHGHSYKLHVSVTTGDGDIGYIPSPGIIVDFKELKRIVNSAVIEELDHKLLLSAQFIKTNATLLSHKNLLVMEGEPTAENLLVFIRGKLEVALPSDIMLAALKLFETDNSYAEWINKQV